LPADRLGRRRSFDDAPHAAPSAAEQQLSKRVFMVLYRM
jgi:hypothetical protein